MARPVLRIENVYKMLGGATVLAGISLALEPGRVVAVWGRSGAGKTTLARIAALIEPPSSGRVYLLDVEASGLGDDERAELRLKYIGYVDQFFTLAEGLTVYENIELPLRLLGLGREERAELVKSIAESLGIGGLLDRLPRGLSGGQRQRAAIARALAKRPRLLVLDEPFSSLDEETKHRVARVLRSYVEGGEAAALVTTTDSRDLVLGDECYQLVGSRLVARDCGIDIE